MREQVKLNGKWYELLEMGRKKLTIIIGSVRIIPWIVDKREVEGFRTI